MSNSSIASITHLVKDFNTRNPYSVIIAGGSITGLLTEDEPKINDIDVYLDISIAYDFISLLDELVTSLNASGGKDLPYKCTRIHSPYDKSFLRKNKISLIVEFRKLISTPIQLMICDRPPLEVVTNFDLTCCECFTDGTEVYGTYLEETLQKKASLRSDYSTALFEGNKFILNRMKKYRSKGFTISISEPIVEVPLNPQLKAILDENAEKLKAVGARSRFINTNLIEITTRSLFCSLTYTNPILLTNQRFHKVCLHYAYLRSEGHYPSHAFTTYLTEIMGSNISRFLRSSSEFMYSTDYNYSEYYSQTGLQSERKKYVYDESLTGNLGTLHQSITLSLVGFTPHNLKSVLGLQEWQFDILCVFLFYCNLSHHTFIILYQTIREHISKDLRFIMDTSFMRHILMVNGLKFKDEEMSPRGFYEKYSPYLPRPVETQKPSLTKEEEEFLSSKDLGIKYHIYNSYSNRDSYRYDEATNRLTSSGTISEVTKDPNVIPGGYYTSYNSFDQSDIRKLIEEGLRGTDFEVLNRAETTLEDVLGLQLDPNP